MLHQAIAEVQSALLGFEIASRIAMSETAKEMMGEHGLVEDVDWFFVPHSALVNGRGMKKVTADAVAAMTASYLQFADGVVRAFAKANQIPKYTEEDANGVFDYDEDNEYRRGQKAADVRENSFDENGVNVALKKILSDRGMASGLKNQTGHRFVGVPDQEFWLEMDGEQANDTLAKVHEMRVENGIVSGHNNMLGHRWTGETDESFAAMGPEQANKTLDKSRKVRADAGRKGGKIGGKKSKRGASKKKPKASSAQQASKKEWYEKTKKETICCIGGCDFETTNPMKWKRFQRDHFGRWRWETRKSFTFHLFCHSGCVAKWEAELARAKAEVAEAKKAGLDATDAKKAQKTAEDVLMRAPGSDETTTYLAKKSVSYNDLVNHKDWMAEEKKK